MGERGPETRYVHRVKAITAKGEGSYSNTETATAFQ